MSVRITRSVLAASAFTAVIAGGAIALSTSAGAASHSRKHDAPRPNAVDASKPPKPHVVDEVQTAAAPAAQPKVADTAPSNAPQPKVADVAPAKAPTAPNSNPLRRETARSRSRSAVPTPVVAQAIPESVFTPISPDHAATQEGAREFRKLVDAGRVQLLNGDRDHAQIESLCSCGLFQWPSPGLVAVKAIAPPAPVSGDSAEHSDGRATGSLPSRATDHDRSVTAAALLPKYCTQPPGTLFRMLNGLAEQSSGARPLAITSLLRPPYKTARYTRQSPVNPHALGIAVDIGAFGGHAIVTSDPESEVQAVLALLRALPPGRYRMGMPKAPDTLRPADPAIPTPDPAAGEGNPVAAVSDAVKIKSRALLASRGGQTLDRAAQPGPRTLVATNWPFFPPPQRITGANGKLVLVFGNEHYAPEVAINDGRVRAALAAARSRGADVFAVFPDGVNHVHLDVKPVP